MSDEERETGLRRVRRGTSTAPLLAKRVPVEPVGVYVDPLSTLVIGSDPLRAWGGLRDQCLLEALDAAYEDADGRLSHDPAYAGGRGRGRSV